MLHKFTVISTTRNVDLNLESRFERNLENVVHTRASTSVSNKIGSNSKQTGSYWSRENQNFAFSTIQISATFI